MRYATASRDGTVKIWNAHTMKLDNKITVVKDIWVTCIHYMTFSKRLVAASANRMISFYDLSSTQYSTPTSRIEGLVGIPLCLEYYNWRESNQKTDDKYETLLVGDDLGIIKMYTITSASWHMCQYKLGSHVGNMTCHEAQIKEKYKLKVNTQFADNEEKKQLDRKNLNKRNNQNNGEQDLDSVKKSKQLEIALKKKQKNMTFVKIEEGVKHTEKLCHKGWITKIKFYDDL